MKTLLLTSALLALGAACTKKVPERAATPPPSAIPDNPVPGDVAPTDNEMPGAPDSTNSVPGDLPPVSPEVVPERDTLPPPGTRQPTPNATPAPNVP